MPNIKQNGNLTLGNKIVLKLLSDSEEKTQNTVISTAFCIGLIICFRVADGYDGSTYDIVFKLQNAPHALITSTEMQSKD